MSPLSRFLRYLPFRCHKCMASSNLQTTRKTLKNFANKTSVEITVTCADLNGRGGCQPLVFRGSHTFPPLKCSQLFGFTHEGVRELRHPRPFGFTERQVDIFIISPRRGSLPLNWSCLHSSSLLAGHSLLRDRTIFFPFISESLSFIFTDFLLCSSLRFSKRYEY